MSAGRTGLRRPAAAQWIGMIVAWLGVVALTTADSAISLDVTTDRTELYIGESVVMTLKISGVSEVIEPDFSAIRDVNVSLLGTSEQNLQSIRIVNGKMLKTEFSGRIYRYRVTPRKTGTVPLGPIRIAHVGRTAKAMGPTLVVRGLEKQDHVRLWITASRTSVLVDEPFEVILNVALRRLPAPHADHDPLLGSHVPNVQVPYLEGEPPDGLEREATEAILQPLLISQPGQAGLGINDYTAHRDPMSSFFSFDGGFGASVARFALPRTSTTRDGIAYHVYQLPVRYVPKREGEHTFGPVSFKGSVVTSVDGGGNAARRRIYAVGEALTVKVVPPPAEGRPATYVGAIGSNLTVEATLETQECSLGDPLRLSLTVQGDISLENLRTPRLEAQPALLKRFRVYDGNPDVREDAGRKTYVYTIRPLEAGTIEVPPIEIGYYDVLTRRYGIAASDPIPLRVRAAAQLAEDYIVAVSNDMESTRQPPDQAKLVIAPITLTEAGSHWPTPLLKAWHLIALTGLPLLTLLAGCGRVLVRRLLATSAPRRRKAALREALQLLTTAEADATRDPAASREALVTALRRFLGAHYGQPESAITPRDAAALMATHKVPTDTARQIVGILERAFNATYDPVAAAGVDLAHEARSARGLLKQLLAILVCALGLAGVARAGYSPSYDFMWQEANTRMSHATSTPGFLAAAASYQEMVSEGLANGPVLRNLGTALLMAGQYRHAELALRGAEIRDGSSNALRRNMRLARAAGSGEIPAPLPWYRVPLRWHYQYPLAQRLSVAIAAISLVWLVVLARVLGWRRGWRECLGVAIVASAITGSSVLASLHTLSRIRIDLLSVDLQHMAATTPSPAEEATP